MGWLILVAYETVALLASRVAFAAIRDTDGAPSDKVDAAGAGFVAFLAGHFWPLAAPIAAVMWRPRKTPDEVLEDNKRMREHIAELERELGIGGTR
jgi:hypothetical protein